MKLSQFEEAFAAFCLRGPCERQRLGSTDHIGHFSPVSEAAENETVSKAEHLLTQLSTVESSHEEAPAFRIEKQLYAQYLRRTLLDAKLTYNGRTNAAQMPIAAERIGDSIFTLLINDERSPKARVLDLLSRVEDVPTFLKNCRERLTAPITRWAQVEQEGVSGLPSLLETAQQFVQDNAPELLDQYQAAASHALAALKDYGSYLENVETTDAFHVGAPAAEAIVKARGIELPLSELKSIASNFLAKTRGEIETLRGTLAQKYDYPSDIDAASLQEKLAAAHPVPVENGLADVLDRYRAEERKVMDFIERTELFPIPTSQSLEIMQTPAFLAPTIPAGAMLPPPPLREGLKKSLVYLTLSEALLAEHNELSIPIMMVHEGIPGHHLQLSWAASHPKLIRRVYDAMDLAEGWTTMLEDYMLDQGYAGALTDEVRFMAKREICRLAARVGIDLYFMTGEAHYLELDGFQVPDSSDPFVRAGALLKSVTGFVDARVQAELNWYSRERGYPLSYLTGNHLVWRLKSAFEAKHGASLDSDRKFHAAILESGNLPVHLLAEAFAENGLI